jgi:hypothetical protein
MRYATISAVRKVECPRAFSSKQHCEASKSAKLPQVKTRTYHRRSYDPASCFYLAGVIGRAKSTLSYAFLRLFALQPLLSPCTSCAQTSPLPRRRFAFTRRGPCVPSRSAPGLSHALHQARKQGCPSSQGLSSLKGGSRQEIAHIPRFAAPPGDAHRARGSRILAPLQRAGCKASTSSSLSAQQLLRWLQSEPLRHLGAGADLEVGFADPHPMRNACELACDRDDREQHARPLGGSAGPTHARPTMS